MLKVVVIGSGNVAQHLIQVFQKPGEVKLVQVFARHTEQLAGIIPPAKVTATMNNIAQADIYIISVSDNAVEEVSSQLPFANRLVVHTSGSMPMEEINQKNRRGVFYPLQTFSKDKAVNFSTVPLCLETENEEDYLVLEKLALSISGSVYKINSTQRRSLHVAAVFVSNFVNHMYAIGSDICSQNNISFEILKPLIKETAEKVNLLPPLQAQTGPAKRSDSKTIEKHLEFLNDASYRDIYNLLTKSIQETNG